MGANLRHQVLLSTTMLVAALGGYARRAYAGATGGACTATGPSTYQCSGSYSVPQTVSADNATVTTVAGFSVNTAAGNAITITGNGAISYEDYNALSLTAAGIALQITLQRRYCKRQCGQRPPSTRTAT